MRNISVEGCEVIGLGAFGVVYKIAQDSVVKVFRQDVPLSRIQQEKERAKRALILGIPTAISYDIVKVGDAYGTVYELLDAEPTDRFVNTSKENREIFVEKSVKLLKEIHEIDVSSAELPNMKANHLAWIETVTDIIGTDAARKIKEIVEEIPDSRKLLHGDFHMKNIVLCDSETMLIDMDTLCFGDAFFDLATMSNSYWTFPRIDSQAATMYLGISVEDAAYIWKKSLALYMWDCDKEAIEEIHRKCQIVGLLRILHFAITGGDPAHKDIMIEKGRKLLNGLIG